jgi:hypothetical protein
VLKKCKEALGYIDALEKNQTILPIPWVKSNERLPSIASNPDFANKSPLLVNDNNMMFPFQAATSQCRKVMESNPIRNISDPMLLSLAQYLKIDMVDLSNKTAKTAGSMVKFSTDAEPVKEPTFVVHTPAAKPTINKNMVINPVSTVRKKMNKIVQTEDYKCVDCTKREFVRSNAKSASTQTSTDDLGSDIESTRYKSDDGGGFSVNLDAAQMQDLTFEQHYALKEFAETFKIPYKQYGVEDNRESNGNNYRDLKYAVSREFERPRSSRERNESRFEDDDRMCFTNPENPNAGRPTAFISLAPRENRPIFERIGEKIQDSPYDPFEERSSVERNERSRYRAPSPGPSRQFRNMSRSRTRSPLHERFSPTPPKRRFNINDRRGRY